MSKIYEALLQAEQDRAANGPETAAEEPRSAVIAIPLPPAPAAATATPAPAAAPAAAMPVPAGPVAGLAPGHAAAEGVAQLWRPQLDKLPSIQPRGSQVEQFRSLRSKMFEFRDLNHLKTVLVSSGRPAEGKSFVAINLAITFARHKSARVLLIDGDMRRASLHGLLGAPSTPGLADYLAGKATIAEILQRGHLEDPAEPLPAGLASLTFVGAGDGGDKAADLSGSTRFGALIAELAPQFDWIIVDSSPVNLVTDGVNLARSCDGVLLIARGGVTRFETAQRAVTEFKSSKILGFVLNALEDAQPADGYYGYNAYDSVNDQPA